MPLNKNHQLAIELKYEGFSYEQISEKMGGKFTTGTLGQYFHKDGILYIPYLQYEAEQNKKRMEDGRTLLQKEVPKAIKVLIDALSNSQFMGKDDRSVELAEKILDRAGLTVIQRARIDKNNNPKELSDDELSRTLGGSGLDPQTGLTVRKAPKK